MISNLSDKIRHNVTFIVKEMLPESVPLRDTFYEIKRKVTARLGLTFYGISILERSSVKIQFGVMHVENKVCDNFVGTLLTLRESQIHSLIIAEIYRKCVSGMHYIQ